MRDFHVMMLERAAVSALVCCLAAPAWGQGAEAPLSDARQAALRVLTGQLADPVRVAKTKFEAAQQLLSWSHSKATEALRGFLEADDNRPAQIAVAEAISHSDAQEKTFIKPLMGMLTGSEGTVRAPAARALATYKNGDVRAELLKLVHDPKRERAIRLEIITILQGQGRLDKKAVAALITLLNDNDAAIRDAVVEALTVLTNIRTFGGDPERWEDWWRKNKDKDQTKWLADLAENLERTNRTLEAENALIRRRLVQAYQDIYTATTSARRDAVLLAYLKDSLPDIKLLGLELSNRRYLVGEKIPDELAQQVRALLTDKDSDVRRSSALLVANLGGDKAAALLLARLEVETSQVVREGLLTALGQLHDPKAVPAILKEIDSKYEKVAAAAALAMGRIVLKNPLDDKQRDLIAKTIVKRYRQNGHTTDGSDLREALLTLMGIIPSKDGTALLIESLEGKAANVRIAAVNALAGLGQAPLAKHLVPLAGDSDRGVRQAVIAALVKLDAPAHLQTILERTRPSVEADAAVRKQAWDGIHQYEKPDLLTTVWKDLAKRKSVMEHQIRIGQKLEAAMVAGKDPNLAAFQRELASVLMAASQPAEAAARLREAHAAMKKADSPETQATWLEWVEALLAAGDPEAVKVIATQKGAAEAFAQAAKLLRTRLKELHDKGQFSQVAVIAAAALDQLADRLTDDQRKELGETLSQARAKQAAADRLFVAKTVLQLVSTDPATAREARESLKAAGDRATAPLVDALRKAVTGPKPDPEMEKAILAVLAHIAPKLTGYSPTATPPEKLKCIDGWLKTLGPADGST